MHDIVPADQVFGDRGKRICSREVDVGGQPLRGGELVPRYVEAIQVGGGRQGFETSMGHMLGTGVSTDADSGDGGLLPRACADVCNPEAIGDGDLGM